MPDLACPDLCLDPCKPCACWPDYQDAGAKLAYIIRRAEEWKAECKGDVVCERAWQDVIDEANQCLRETDNHDPKATDGPHVTHTCLQLYEHVSLAVGFVDVGDAFCCLTELNHMDAGAPLTPPARR
jgi:hypothetical protein